MSLFAYKKFPWHFAVKQEGIAYQCKLTPKRLLNLALSRFNKPFLPRWEISLPHILHVGVTTACNLRCPGCPTGTKALGRKTEHLDIDLYKRTIDDLKNSVMFALFWDWGEPLLHPQLAEMIEYARARKIRTVISTNGNLSKNQQQIDQLVKSQPDVLIFCIDGATQESYESYRVGGKLSLVLQMINRVNQAKKRLNLDYPVIELRTLATKYSERELPELFKMAQEYECDVFSVKSLRPYDYRGHDIDNELTPLSPDLARYQYTSGVPISGKSRMAEEEQPLQCGKPLYAPTLNSDGDLVFCSYSRSEETSFGNLFEQPVKKLWKTKSAALKRQTFLERGGLDLCSSCYFRSNTKSTILHSVQLNDLPKDLSLTAHESKDDFNRFLTENYEQPKMLKS